MSSELRKAPAARNDILAKRFGIPMEGYTYFFTYEETLPRFVSVHCIMECLARLGCRRFRRVMTLLGVHFLSFRFRMEIDIGIVKTRSYVSELTMMKLPGAMRIKYEEFIREGSLHVLEGTVLDMMQVYDDLDKFIIDMQYDIRAFGYDPYNAKEFLTRWEAENGPFGIEKVIQGAKTESVPLGELKILSEQRMLVFDQELMSFAMGNSITLEDTNGNRKLLKKRQDQKIDNVAALMDAYVAFKANKEQFD
jgi:phage terminase large subunit-like protein